MFQSYLLVCPEIFVNYDLPMFRYNWTYSILYCSCIFPYNFLGCLISVSRYNWAQDADSIEHL